ncbi:hypothetical protein ACTJJ4_11695 [Microbacterium sp. 22195]|uniref:hypothetical protein n=1 Tax=Microbacterium sp. 22195 TaxID=3453891 RepID=UPI003F824DF0
MTINLDELEAVARAATPGPWLAIPSRRERGAYEILGVAPVVRTSTPTMLHIAAFDPPTVLALIAELRRARECIEKVRGWWMSDQAPTVSYKQYLGLNAILATYDQEGAS